MWESALAAGLASLGLVLGDFLTRRLGPSARTIGFILALSAGILMSVVSYSLIEDTLDSTSNDWIVPLGLAIGSLVYFFCDNLVTRKTEGNEGASIALGSLLDGVPESLVIGISAAIGGGQSMPMIVAALASNFPQGGAGGADLEEAGTDSRKITMIWLVISLASAIAALIGYRFIAGTAEDAGAFFNGFAAGALLMVLTDSMIPDAHHKSGEKTGLFVVLGFAIGFGLARFA